jgi:hypothetical protein
VLIRRPFDRIIFSLRHKRRLENIVGTMKAHVLFVILILLFVSEIIVMLTTSTIVAECKTREEDRIGNGGSKCKDYLYF